MIECIPEQVKSFAIHQGYSTAEYLCEWNGFHCYEPILDDSEDNTAYVGLPLLILVDNSNNIRMSTPEEARKIEPGYYEAEPSIDKGTGRNCIFYKEHRDDKVWWVDYPEIIGDLAVTFDKVKIYHLFADYPQNFTKEEKDLFDKENPYWKNFFKDRQ